MTFRTTLCDLLDIAYPIVQSGMGAIAGPDLVVEVCRAGGLGILAGLNVPPDDLRKMIHRTRELTNRPFGVNLWLHRALRPPIDPDAIREETLRGAQEMLNRFRQRLGIPTTMARPARAPDLVDAAIKVVLDERPPVFSAALGWLEPGLVDDCRRRRMPPLWGSWPCCPRSSTRYESPSWPRAESRMAAASSPPSPSGRAACCWGHASWPPENRWPPSSTRSGSSRARATRPR